MRNILSIALIVFGAGEVRCQDFDNAAVTYNINDMDIVVGVNELSASRTNVGNLVLTTVGASGGFVVGALVGGGIAYVLTSTGPYDFVPVPSLILGSLVGGAAAGLAASYLSTAEDGTLRTVLVSSLVATAAYVTIFGLIDGSNISHAIYIPISSIVSAVTLANMP